MKYIWEESDLRGAWGRYIMLNCSEDKSDYKNITHMWKVGGDGYKKTLTCMGDGYVVRFENYDKLLVHLNTNKMGYRPVKKEELLDAIDHNWFRNENNEN